MYFVLEFKGEPRRMVKAKATATLTDVVEKAYGFGLGIIYMSTVRVTSR